MGNPIVRKNLMECKDYSPYCGDFLDCCTMPRTRFDGNQFVCPDCGWRSEFPESFMKTYKRKWDLR